MFRSVTLRLCSCCARVDLGGYFHLSCPCCSPLVATCPSGHTGENVITGCTCNQGPGYSGTTTPKVGSPYFSGGCQPVACPTKSHGACVVRCVRRRSLIPTITPRTKHCRCCVAGTNLPAGCTCNAGYVSHHWEESSDQQREQ